MFLHYIGDKNYKQNNGDKKIDIRKLNVENLNVEN